MLLPLFVLYLADLIANVADVIATFFFLCVLADVIAMVVDVKTTQGNSYMADVIAICG